MELICDNLSIFTRPRRPQLTSMPIPFNRTIMDKNLCSGMQLLRGIIL